METIAVRTSGHTELKEITRMVEAAAAESDVQDGICMVFVPHTTAGVTLNENADPAAREDVSAILDRLVPWEGPYRHAEGNSAAHAKASLVGQSLMVPLGGGRLLLGTWQGIYFCEFDGPRTREVQVQVVPCAAGAEQRR